MAEYDKYMYRQNVWGVQKGRNRICLDNVI